SFCSELCRAAFMQAPDRYLASGAGGDASAGRGPCRYAYFSMEVGVDPRLPTYAGGLGILAGDMLKTFADMQVPAVGVSLLHRAGYFEQTLDAEGGQHESAVGWEPAALLRPLPNRIEVSIRGRAVAIGAWRYDVRGSSGHLVPLVLLDTDVDGNAAEDRRLTASLYSGDEHHRLAQEIVLGIGGVRMLRDLALGSLSHFHMNEGHSALLALELLGEPAASGWDYTGVREKCVFTTHTPVPAGHDQFDYGLVRHVLGDPVPPEILRMLGGTDRLNMTLLAMNLSGSVNGVAKRHREVSQEMFPAYPIGSITNGVHSRTWTCPEFASLFDGHIPGWQDDPYSLRHAVSLPGHAVWEAHQAAKRRLMDVVRLKSGKGLAPDAFTIGFARRFTAYKRPELLFADLDRLAGIAGDGSPLQVVLAGKAHPRDDAGKALIRRVVSCARRLEGRVAVAFLENYDMEFARLMTSGVDLWLNTPLPPLEASGTSGMKAAHNGIPSLSVVDGWWVEGHIEGVTGWSIGPRSADSTEGDDATDLYAKLEHVILPLYYRQRERWIDVMRGCIALNASHFHSHRMVQQYLALAYGG
ncbi:MAG TPA: alpha-glucan family phosphorylase, partial [Planctomycetota bacterium]|nr:alpha-glucan family phosphorylase [Planctomycetota bacterium]